MEIDEENYLSANEFMALRKDVGWDVPSESDSSFALKGSLMVFVKRINSKAVGAVRIVGDGKVCFYIQDLMVLKEYRRKGIATELMNKVMEYIDKKAAYNAFIGLMAAKGVEKLYEKYNFIQRPNEQFGPGMTKFYGRDGQSIET